MNIAMTPFIQVGLRRSLLILLCAGMVVSSVAAEGAANALKVIDGVLNQPLLLPDDHVAEMTTEDGGTYYVDLRALPREPMRLEPNTAITVVGYEGDRPDAISAHKLKVREIPPKAPVGHSTADLRVIEGKIAFMTPEALTLRTPNGAMAVVRIPGSSARFRSGETVRVFGVLARDDVFAANVLIFLTSPRSEISANMTDHRTKREDRGR
jgi:hypothetical protein